MSRSLTIQDSLLTGSHESKQRSKPFETGLLVAHHGAKVDTILRLVPTPSAEEGKEATALDAEWMLQHAAQVGKMLPGGIIVLGVYVLAPNAKLSTMEPRLQLLLGSLAAAPGARFGAEAHPVVLLLPTDSKKPAARSCAPGAARLQPLEIKTTREAAALHCVAADVAVDVPLRLSAEQVAAGPTDGTRAALQAQITRHLASLAAAVVTVDGGVPAAGALVDGLRGEGSLATPHVARFFSAGFPGGAPGGAPGGGARGAEGDGEEGEDGPTGGAEAEGAEAEGAVAFRLRGTMHGRAFATGREEVREAVSDLVSDLCGCAAQRAALLVEEMQEAEEEEDEDGFELVRVGAWPTPRRVHVPASGGAGGGAASGDGPLRFSWCDYLSQGEELADVAAPQPAQTARVVLAQPLRARSAAGGMGVCVGECERGVVGGGVGGSARRSALESRRRALGRPASACAAAPGEASLSRASLAHLPGAFRSQERISALLGQPGELPAPAALGPEAAAEAAAPRMLDAPPARAAPPPAPAKAAKAASAAGGAPVGAPAPARGNALLVAAAGAVALLGVGFALLAGGGEVEEAAAAVQEAAEGAAAAATEAVEAASS